MVTPAVLELYSMLSTLNSLVKLSLGNMVNINVGSCLWQCKHSFSMDHNYIMIICDHPVIFLLVWYTITIIMLQSMEYLFHC